MKTPVNAKTLKQHLTYNWWKYLLVVLFAIFGTDLLYTVTAYRSPPEKRVDFYVYGAMDEEKMDAYMEKIRIDQMSDMEVMDASLMIPDASYGAMQLSTYLAAGEGDLYLLPREEFMSYAGGGAFLALEEDTELMNLFTEANLSLQSGWRKNTEEEVSHLYGIPISRLPGLSNYAYAKDGYLCVLVTGGNNDNTLKFLHILCADMIEPEEPVPSPEAGTP